MGLGDFRVERVEVVSVSSVLENIVIGLVTSVIGGGAVWLWQRLRNLRALRRKERFFGIEPGGTCLIVMNNKYDMPGSANHNDVQAMIEIATLASNIGSSVLIESCNEFHEVNGNRTEFCVGGPSGGSNPRTGGHLAANLPGVTLRPHDPALRDSMAIIVGREQFPCVPGSQAHALVAKFTPPASSRPVFIICGQTSIANRAATHFLKREYLSLSKSLSSTDRFCIIVRAAAIDTYGYQAGELASDVSTVAFHSYKQPSAPAGNVARA
jgi:hypothetical protein